MAERARRTPLTLAVLSLLNENPRHPYEMQSLIKERRVGDVVRMRGGSLYDAIARLAKLGLIEVAGTARSGARPERTVYAITESGRDELFSLLREYLGTKAEEYPVFPAGLGHILNVSTVEAADLLRRRADELAATMERIRSELGAAAGVPRVVLLEVEYAQALRHAELEWLRGVLRDIEAGELDWAEQGQHTEGGR